MVKPLDDRRPDTKVPTDATMVVIGRADQSLPGLRLKALDEYMGKGGKMVVLLGPTLNRKQTEMVKTGLEPFLARYNVQVGNDRDAEPAQQGQQAVKRPAGDGKPRAAGQPANSAIRAVAHPAGGRHPAGSAGAGAPGMMSRLRTESLLVSYPGVPVWAEANLQHQPHPAVSSTIANAPLERRAQVDQGNAGRGRRDGDDRAAPEPAHVHAAVADGAEAPAGGRRQFSHGVQPFYQCGCRQVGYEFLGQLDGMAAGTTRNIGIAPKKHQVYALPAGTNFWPFVLMPTALILFGIVGLGTGVWLVRRR